MERTYTERANLNKLIFGTLSSNGHAMIGVGLSQIVVTLALFGDHSNTSASIIAGATVLLIGICCLVAHYGKDGLQKRQRTYTERANLNKLIFGTLLSNGHVTIGIGLSQIVVAPALFSDHSNSRVAIIAGAIVLLIGICCLVAHYRKERLQNRRDDA